MNLNPELRWRVYGNDGYMRLRLPSEADAMKILVLTRGCAQGFCSAMELSGQKRSRIHLKQ